MNNQVSKLKNKLLGEKEIKQTRFTSLAFFAREFASLTSILGSDFEVRDAKGNLVYTIRQKPVTLNQLNIFLKELDTLQKLEVKSAKDNTSKKRGRKK